MMDNLVEIKEGQIYEGTISLSGSDDVKRRWIVVSPFGKTHIHSIDNPAELHCWPLSLIHEGLRNGKLRLIETSMNHPILLLQREKETYGIRDTHLGLEGDSLEKMFTLLQDAAESGKPYTLYAAGEIMEFIKRSAPATEHYSESQARVSHILETWNSSSYIV